jgi:hemerythrin superfamily protein
MAKQRNKRGSRRGRADGRSPGFFRTVGALVSDGIERVVSSGSSDDSLNAIDLLRAQHKAVERLFGQIQSARGEAKAAAFRELADLLAVHATIEEKIFYPNVKSPATEDLLLESVDEHLSMKRTLADLMQMEVGGDEFDAKLSVLEEEVTHHAKKEEEPKLFPKVWAEKDADFLAALANEMIAMMVELQQKGAPREAVPGETDAPAPI